MSSFTIHLAELKTMYFLFRTENLSIKTMFTRKKISQPGSQSKKDMIHLL